MAQWFALKADQPDALLFFRMGDFYELFFDDAVAAAAVLNIVLTRRGEHDGAPIPMCGVPLAHAETYLGRLIRRGFRVAIVEQMEKGPSEGGPRRSAKTPLRREIVRLVTPGTLTEDALLESGRPSLLLAIGTDGPDGPLGLAVADVATGLVETERLDRDALPDALARLHPAEILSPPDLALGPYEPTRAPPRAVPPAALARRRAADAFGAASLDAFDRFSDAEAVALAVLLDYLRAAGAGTLPRLAAPIARGRAGHLGIDPATRASLAITRAPDGDDAHTLLAAVRRTLTAAGERLLARRLESPLDDLPALLERQAEWVALRDDPDRAASLRTLLRGLPDAERALGRLSVGRASPRDLAAIGTVCAAGDAAATALAEADPPLAAWRADLACGATLAADIAATLVPGPPARLEDGAVIADGIDPALDEARRLATDGRRAIAAQQPVLAARYGVASLRIRHHAQLGSVLEVPQADAESLRNRPGLSLRQGMANGARFVSDELAELDRRIAHAQGEVATRERALFEALAARALASPAPAAIAARLARLDVAQSAAALAATGGWCLPTLRDDRSFTVESGRHPVVEAALPPGQRFVANDAELGPATRVMLLTGPNMAGKSTYLRQLAIAVILAQSGLPVPAASARIGLVDRLFSRVGASDDLARGRSTFMVEMTEAAGILNAAGPRSLVVVDEIGRGTSTLDGLAIATAMLEALHDQVRARTVFATHFHELAHLATRLRFLAPRTMRVSEWRGEVVFRHEVVDGAGGRSWGVHVARLAGVPPRVVARARALLDALERRGRLADPGQALPLLAPLEQPPGPARALADAIAAIDPDALTPREAHEALYRLKALVAAPKDDLSGRRDDT